MNIYSTIKLMSLTRHFLRDKSIARHPIIYREPRDGKVNEIHGSLCFELVVQQAMSNRCHEVLPSRQLLAEHLKSMEVLQFLTAFCKEQLFAKNIWKCVVFYSRQLWRTGFSWAPIKSLLWLRELIHELLFLYCIFLFGYAISYLLMQWMR